MNEPSQEYLLAAFTYCPTTGILRGNPDRPTSHFKDDGRRRRWVTTCAGRIVGSVTRQGYIRIIANGKRCMAHRVIFVMMKGSIPEGMEIDHRNGIRRDNKWFNLRLATKRQNKQNMAKTGRNASGTIGVSWDKARCQWKASVNRDGRPVMIGRYNTMEAAVSARRTEEAIHYGEFALSASRPT